MPSRAWHRAGLNYPLRTRVSPTFLKNPLSAYGMLRQGGYTDLLLYLAQQIQQFRLRRVEVVMRLFEQQSPVDGNNPSPKIVTEPLDHARQTTALR